MGLLVVYSPILEREGAVVCIGMSAMVAGMMAEVDDNEFAPSLQRSIGGTGAQVQSSLLWGPLFDLTENYRLGV